MIKEDLDEINEEIAFTAKQTFNATLNILEDIQDEKESAGETTQAVLNILEDLAEEQTLTQTLNTQLEQRVLERTAELARSEERFRLLIEGVTDYAIFMLDPKGNIVTWNTGAERLNGYTSEEIIGHHFSCFYPEADLTAGKPESELQMALANGSFEDEGIRLRKDGSKFLANVVITAVYDETGKHVGYAKITRDNSERARAENRFRAVVESTATAIVMIDQDGKMQMVNVHTESLFGYQRKELLGKKVEMLIPPQFRVEHPGQRDSFFDKPVARRMGRGRDLHGLRKDGSTFPVEIGLNPIETDEGLFVIGTIADITERLAAQAQRVEALRREVLLKEIHHRVKNNLQVISSLLFLQSSYIKDEKTLEILRESQTRISSIALIHEKLYRSDDLAKVDFGEYVRDLTAELFRTYSINQEAVVLNTTLDDVFLQIDTAIPCGLIINELISNALKHAFPSGRQGQVNLSLTQADDVFFHLIVHDNGVGLPKDFDWRTTKSFGLRLVMDLAMQMDGEIELDTSNGTMFKIVFKDTVNSESEIQR